jgi:DNA-binding Xre family transcriptional regulator
MEDRAINGKISYVKLFKLLLDRRMKKGDLCSLSGISHSSLAKLGKGDNVNTEVLVKICLALNVGLDDIMELERLPDEQ